MGVIPWFPWERWDNQAIKWLYFYSGIPSWDNQAIIWLYFYSGIPPWEPWDNQAIKWLYFCSENRSFLVSLISLIKHYFSSENRSFLEVELVTHTYTRIFTRLVT